MLQLLQEQEVERTEGDDSPASWFTQVFGYGTKSVRSQEEIEEERQDAAFYFSNGSLGRESASFRSGLDLPTRELLPHETLSQERKPR